MQKSLEAYRNSGIRPNWKFLKRVCYNDKFCKNKSLKQNVTSMLRTTHSQHFLKSNNIHAAYFYWVSFKQQFPEKMNILGISKPQKWRKFKNNEPQTKIIGSYKKIVFFCWKWSKSWQNKQALFTFEYLRTLSQFYRFTNCVLTHSPYIS